MDDWWRGSVTYQIYPRSFQDANGDGVGDLAGITERLPYVADLGVDAIWLSPIFTSPMADMGYDVSDYTDIDPIFGTLADFDAMVARAHALGLKVIVDQVLSHSSDRHPFFRESRRAGPTRRPTGTSGPTRSLTARRRTTGSRCSAAAPGPGTSRRYQYYLHNFLAEQPDFNFHNPDVQDWLLSTMRFWLERGVDGFRLDTVNFYFHDKLLRDDPPDFRRKEKPDWNPYAMQYHLFSKNQPENLALPRADAGAPRRVRGARDGRRDGREPPRDPDDGRVHDRQAAAQMLLVRDARLPRSAPRTSAARSRSSSPALPAAGRPGRSPTTTWCAMSAAGPGTASAASRWPSSRLRCSCRCRARSASTRARSSARPRPTSSTTS